eukprot:TRINITY_DN31894_c0_g1_i1.p1 TRINITY_DN31894_c0_g1~~TRINITY_DN31894_c0_g1_i1.p1  ORF type:complete len:215 (+),score=25.46 TRINITY_DN31894_c0_g1_i1:49-693(+)
MERDEVLPKDNKEYATQQYWDERYQKDPVPYDWFKGYEELKAVLGQHVKKSDAILMSGCGSSLLSEDMYKDGFQRITNVDFSPEVIRLMSERCKDLTEMSWLVMDVMKMEFPGGSFDIVLDKGTMDAVLCEQGDAWTVPEKLAADVDQMLTEISRVLTDTGAFIYITFGQPHFRRKLLEKEKYGWTMTVQTIGVFFHYFVYVCKKSPSSSQQQQ